MYPDPQLQRRLNRDAFFAEMEASKNERVWPKIAERVEQDVASVIRVGLGQIPKPVQLSGTTAGMNAARVKSLKDYSQTTTVVEWDLSIGLPRSVVEDLPEEAARIGREHGNSSSVFFDERVIGALDSTTALGYDGKALFSSTHNESGANQNNTGTSAGTPTASQVEAALTPSLAAMAGFTDDQARPANEGVSNFVILVNPLQYFAFKTVVDPTMRDQAVDVSGVTGVVRGMFTLIQSAYVPSKTFYIFAQSRIRKALGLYVKTDWDYHSNIGTDSDAWQHGRQAIFTGYARFEAQPRDWKSAFRYIFT